MVLYRYRRFQAAPQRQAWSRQPSIELCAQECGARCCRAPNWVALNDHEMRRLRALKPEIKVLNIERGAWALDFGDNGGACPFLANNLCSIYDERPFDCRRFPVAPQDFCLVWPKCAEPTQ